MSGWPRGLRSGDLVVVVDPWTLAHGRVVPLAGWCAFRSYPWRVHPPGSAKAATCVRDVRPPTPEELAAHWLEHGAGA